jgi:hypothetical protein
MYAPIAAAIACRATAELATSGLPDAPVRPAPWPPNRGIVAHLRSLLARPGAVPQPGNAPGQHVTAAPAFGAVRRAALVPGMRTRPGPPGSVRTYPADPLGVLSRAMSDRTLPWLLTQPGGADGSGRVHPNFPDPALEDWAAAYLAGNYPRLASVKNACDPHRFFDFP